MENMERPGVWRLSENMEELGAGERKSGENRRPRSKVRLQTVHTSEALLIPGANASGTDPWFAGKAGRGPRAGDFGGQRRSLCLRSTLEKQRREQPARV